MLSYGSSVKSLQGAEQAVGNDEVRPEPHCEEIRFQAQKVTLNSLGNGGNCSEWGRVKMVKSTFYESLW